MIVKLGVAFCAFLIVLYLIKPSDDFKKVKEIHIAWGEFPRSFDPRYATDADSQYLEDLLHCSLVSFDENGNLRYDLVEKAFWQDATHLEVTLKKTFKFSDGSSVTAQNVKDTYDFFLENRDGTVGKASPRALAFRHLKKVSLAQDVLIFELEKPDASFITNLVIGILKKDVAKGPMLEQGGKIPSCGAFYLENSDLTEIVLNRNSYHPNFNLSYQDKVIIHIVKDETTRLAKLEKGELDIVQNTINIEKLNELKKSPDFYVLEKEALKTNYLGFNFKHPILSKQEVREAIAHGIQKEKIIQYVFAGLASKADEFLPENNTFFSGKKNQDIYDLALAQKLLDQAGFPLKKGEKYRFSLKLTIPNTPQRYATARSLMEDFSRMGIDIQLRTEEWGKFQQDVEKGLVDMWILTWIGYKDPDIYRYAFSGDSFPPNGANRGWYKNENLDLLLEEGLRVIEIGKRKAIYLKAEEIIHADRPYIFLLHEKNFSVVTTKIEGFKIFADGRYSSLAVTRKNEPK